MTIWNFIDFMDSGEKETRTAAIKTLKHYILFFVTKDREKSKKSLKTSSAIIIFYWVFVFNRFQKPWKLKKNTKKPKISN